MDALDAFMEGIDSDARSLAQETWVSRAASVSSSDEHQARVRRRRYARLLELQRDTDYFSDAKMKERRPKEYHDMLGKHLGESLEDNFDYCCEKMDSDDVCDAEKLVPLLREALTTVHTQRLERLREQNPPFQPEEDSDDEGSSHALEMDHEHEDVELMHGYSVQSTNAQQEIHERTQPRATDSASVTIHPEVLAGRSELTSIMADYFMNGHDTEFVDYSQIDSDERLDVFVEYERDLEEKWFDSELEN